MKAPTQIILADVIDTHGRRKIKQKDCDLNTPTCAARCQRQNTLIRGNSIDSEIDFHASEKTHE
jgi:hypothetical protein